MPRLRLELSLTTVCAGCQCARDLDDGAQLVAAGKSRVVLKLPTACACGDQRVEVRARAKGA